MRKVGLTALAVLLVAATLATAGDTPCRQGVRFAGQITAIRPDAQQIVVGEQVVQVTEDTVILQNCRPITFDDLQVRMNVMGYGTRGDHGVIIAQKIMVMMHGN